MAKPTVLPRWATDGAADVATPASGKQDVGWAAGEEPPAPYSNWLGLHTYNWIKWLDDNNPTQVTLALTAADAYAYTPSGISPILTSFSNRVGLESNTSNAISFMFPLPQIQAGDRFDELTVHGRGGNGALEVFSVGLYQHNLSTGTITIVGATKSNANSNANNSVSWTSADSGYPHTVTNPILVIGTIPATSAADECRVYGITVSYTPEAQI